MIRDDRLEERFEALVRDLCCDEVERDDGGVGRCLQAAGRA